MTGQERLAAAVIRYADEPLPPADMGVVLGTYVTWADITRWRQHMKR